MHADISSYYQCPISGYFPGKTQISDRTLSPRRISVRILPSVQSIFFLDDLSCTESSLKIPDPVIVRYQLPLWHSAFGSIWSVAENEKSKWISDWRTNGMPRKRDKMLTRYFVGGCRSFLMSNRLSRMDFSVYSGWTKVFLPHRSVPCSS